MWTQLWSLIPSRRVALTADTCHQAFTCASEFTASSSRSSRRLPRVGARTLTAASASRGGSGGSCSATGRLKQYAFPQAATGHLERTAQALRGGPEDQQPRG